MENNEETRDPEMLAIIKQMQKHMIFLEKKIDTIIKALPSKPAEGDYRPRRSKPPRSNDFPYQRRGEKPGYPPARSGNFERDRPFKTWHGKREGGFKRKHKKFGAQGG